MYPYSSIGPGINAKLQILDNLLFGMALEMCKGTGEFR